MFVIFRVISIVAFFIITPRTLTQSKYLVLDHGYAAKMLIQLRSNSVALNRYDDASLKVNSPLELSTTVNPSEYTHSFEEQDTRLGFRKLVLQKQKGVGESEKLVL